jgi:hypothetical protein
MSPAAGKRSLVHQGGSLAGVRYPRAFIGPLWSSETQKASGLGALKNFKALRRPLLGCCGVSSWVRRSRWINVRFRPRGRLSSDIAGRLKSANA